MADTTPTEWFQRALSAYGQDYLAAEKALRGGGDAALTVLNQVAADTTQTPLARFIATTLANVSGDRGAACDSALSALNGLEVHAGKTPRSVPDVEIAAGRLSRFGDITDFIALRMLKETEWPEWKVMAAIVYLGYWAGASVLPALDQFQADLKAGQRANIGDDVDEETQDIIAKLDEAAQLVRIVIEDETFKTDLAKAKAAAGPEQEEALQLAVVRALSLITADPERAKQLEDMSETFKTLVLEPVLSATAGSVPSDQVRRILADYLLGTGTHKAKPES